MAWPFAGNDVAYGRLIISPREGLQPCGDLNIIFSRGNRDKMCAPYLVCDHSECIYVTLPRWNAVLKTETTWIQQFRSCVSDGVGRGGSHATGIHGIWI